MTATLESLEPRDIPSCLRGVRFPAGKRDILTGARLNRAPRQVMEILHRFPEIQYQGLREVLRGYKQLLCSNWSPALRN